MRTRFLVVLLFLFGLPLFAANDGTIVGSPTFSAGKFGSQVTGLSDSSYVTIPLASSAAFRTSNFTWKGWLTTTSTSIRVAYWLGHDGGTSAMWFGVASNGHFAVTMPGFNGNNYVDSGATINDGTKHFCEVVVSSGTTLSIYVDGTRVSQNSGTYSADTAATANYLGRFYATGFAWDGAIDEVSYWSTATQTGTTSTVQSAAYTGSETGLAALYHLDGNASDSFAPAAVTTVTLPQANVFFPAQGWDTTTTAHAITSSAGNYFRANFTTSAAGAFGVNVNTAQFGSTADGSRPSLTYSMDNGTPQQIVLTAANTSGGVVYLGGSIAAGAHTLKVIYRSSDPLVNHWNLASANVALDVTGFTAAGGGTITFSAVTRRPNTCLFYGDSMTEGEGTEALASANFQANDDATHNYVPLLAHAMNCEYSVAAYGGQGWSTGASDGATPAFPSSWGYLYSGKSRSFAGLTHVFINHGTNDGGSIGGTGTLKTFLTNLRAALTSAGSSTAKVFDLVPFSGLGQSALLADFTSYQGSVTSATVGSSKLYTGTADANTAFIDTQAILGSNSGAHSIYSLYSFDNTHLNTNGNSIVASVLSSAASTQPAAVTTGRSLSFF